MPVSDFMTKERHDERIRMAQAGDTEGVRRWYFGVYVHNMRELAGLTQEEAAARAGLTRVQWSRIENGHDLPKRTNISAIADAIHVDIAGLYRRAGYGVPDDLGLFDMKRSKRDLEVSLLESLSMAEFLLDMQLVWQRFQLQRLGQKQRWYSDPGYAQVIEYLYEKFSLKQRVALAQAIIQRSPKGTVPNDVFGPHRFLDRLDSWVEEVSLREGEEEEADFILVSHPAEVCATSDPG